MSKGQYKYARQPVARAKGREASQSRFPHEQRAPAAKQPANLLFAKPASASAEPRGHQPQPVHQRKSFVRTPQGKLMRTERLPIAGEEDVGKSTECRVPEVLVPRAKKLLVRAPNQQIVERNKSLKKRRVALEDIEAVRLQKALAQSGMGSRREMEEWIEAGLITVNGKVAVLGNRVGPHDRIMVKGSPVKLKWADRLPRVILYHKMEGEIVTRSDPQGRVTVFDRLPQAKSSRWVAVGRLDVNTSGLLILTTCGMLANHLMHPSFEVEREYAVRVIGQLSEENKKQLSDGITLDDGPASVVRIIDQGGEGTNHWYRVVIKEGRNREVRRLFEFINLPISRLMRVRFGHIGLPARLKRGHFYELNEVEVAAVMKWSNLSVTGGKR